MQEALRVIFHILTDRFLQMVLPGQDRTPGLDVKPPI